VQPPNRVGAFLKTVASAAWGRTGRNLAASRLILMRATCGAEPQDR
jgi:hypothetical protein